MYVYILLLLLLLLIIIYNTTGENIPLHHVSTTTCTTTCYNIIDTYSIIRMCVSMAACIAEGRLAPANGRNPGRQDCRAAPVCSFVVPKMGPKTGLKNGPHYCQKKERLPKWRPRFWTRVLHAQWAPLCVQWVAETPEHFVCFPGNGLDKASPKFHSIYNII